MKTLSTVARLATAVRAGMILAGCLRNGSDGATGPQGPAGEDGESYVSYTNDVSGNITTIAVTAGNNSPVEITINDASGAGASAGTRATPPAPAAAPEDPVPAEGE